jgi:hypothetical protein|tara:strand:- start:435 stop:722 length:288 start_codon:yes stop_codon:yes gene_type:complete
MDEETLQALGKPPIEEWEKMSTKEKIEAVASVHHQVKAMERQAKGFQFEAALMKREILEPSLEEVRLLIRQGSMPLSDRDALRKLVEFIECIDEP